MATGTPRVAPNRTREPASFPGAFAYEHTDMPPGVTLDEYRRQRVSASRDAKRTRRAARRRRIPRIIRTPLDGLAAGPRAARAHR